VKGTEVDVEAHIDQVEQLLAAARPVPLSGSIIVNRQELEDLLAELRDALPKELRQARWIIKERDELLEQAARESEQIVADARLERERLLSDTELVRGAEREAERIAEEAREQARRLTLEAEDYVDGKLSAFEAILRKTMVTVTNGRERLRGQPPAEEDRPPGAIAEALPRAQFFDQERATEGTRPPAPPEAR
jgi:cell division septum initiation protein DivIVA